MDRFILKSSPLCFAPGIIRYCQELANGNQPEVARNILAAWNEDPRIVDAVFKGEYTCEGDMVIVEVGHYTESGDVFADLYERTKHVVKAYETDFDHDRDLIDYMGHDVPFIHIAREMGTHIITLPPADHKCWPAEGVKIPYLFGRANREHILRQVNESVAYHKRNNPDALWTYYNGSRLMITSPSEAARICYDYVLGIKQEWKNDS